MERRLRNKLPNDRFDNVDPIHSRRMAAVRGRNNRSTERRLRASLVRASIGGWHMHDASLAGCPDFVFPKHRIVVFVDGCFWHGCPKCKHQLRTNTSFWIAKIRRNRARDRRNTKSLRQQGFVVVRVWEHEVVAVGRTVERILIAIENYPKSLKGVSRREKQAIARVRLAGVNAPVEAVLGWIRSTGGADAMLSARLSEILCVANAF